MNEFIIWSPGVTLVEVEKQVILKAYRFFRGNRTSTANALGISIRTLTTRLEEYEKANKEMELQNELERKQRAALLARHRGNPTIDEFGNSVLNASSSSVNSESRPIANASPTGEGSLGAITGVRVEPAVEVRTQQTVPMPQRQEIQGVSPKHSSPGHPKKSR